MDVRQQREAEFSHLNDNSDTTVLLKKTFEETVISIKMVNAMSDWCFLVFVCEPSGKLLPFPKQVKSHKARDDGVLWNGAAMSERREKTPG